MKRGLYVRAGDCATARLAACAISLFGPTTNDSKLFRGLSPSALLDCLASREFSRAEFLSWNLRETLFVQSLGSRRKFHFPRRAKSGDDRRLQRRHMITFDPELIDVVWNSKRKRVVRRLDELNRGKPALKSVRTNLRFERCRQFLPELSVILVHTDLLTALSNPPREGRRQKLRGKM